METMPPTVECVISSTIRPSDINTDSPLDMKDTLGFFEYESIAGCLIIASKKDGNQWVGFVYTCPAGAYSRLKEMVYLDLLSETKVEDRWIYALTPSAIDQIHKRQRERVVRLQNKPQPQPAPKIGFLARVRDWWMQAFA